MKLNPQKIFSEFEDAKNFKCSIGNKGLYDQILINERFFMGDQWHGANCGNDRPLARYNIIKRIGEYKMSQIMGNPVSVTFSADGITNINNKNDTIKIRKKDIAKNKNFCFEGNADDSEVNLIMSALGNYRNVTSERVGFDSLSERALHNAYISGSTVFYTYWDQSILTGLYDSSDSRIGIKGDIKCEVLDIENVYFGDPYNNEVQTQPYIIISSNRPIDQVKQEANYFGASKETMQIIDKNSVDNKIIVLTRLYKEYNADGSYSIKCTKVVNNAFIRQEFDTGLRLYPLALFTWQCKNNLAYGESEITYLIPNQIAINRMITANIWSAMSMGMPMMVVNGDTVNDTVTNEPGQIIKVFGSNEDVAGAVKYVAPPQFGENFNSSINSLIENTLSQSGANQVALGDSKPDNATALETMRNAATMPLQLVKNRFYSFVEDISRIWADFWITHYGNRKIKISDENGIWYLPFNADRYKNLLINTKISAGTGTNYSEEQTITILKSLYNDKIIDREQFLRRLPNGLVPDIDSLINNYNNSEEEKGNDRL